MEGETEKKNDTKRLVVFVVLMLVLGVIYFGFKYYQKQTTPTSKFPEASTTSLVINFQDMQRMEVASDEFPVGFSKDISFPKDAKIVDRYNLRDSRFDQPTEAVVVLESAKTPEEIKEFYQSQLKEPDFKFIEGSDSGDTEIKKIMVYSVSTGVVIIMAEKIDTGSKIKIQQSDLVIKPRLLQ